MHQRDLVDLLMLCWQKGRDCWNRFPTHEHEHTRLRLAAPSSGTAACFTMEHSGATRYKQANTHTGKCINKNIKWSQGIE